MNPTAKLTPEARRILTALLNAGFDGRKVAGKTAVADEVQAFSQKHFGFDVDYDPYPGDDSAYYWLVDTENAQWPMRINGALLTPAQQAEATNMFVHRHTVDNPHPSREPQRGPRTMTDRQWLEITEFYVRKDGHLAHMHCYTNYRALEA